MQRAQEYGEHTVPPVHMSLASHVIYTDTYRLTACMADAMDAAAHVDMDTSHRDRASTDRAHGDEYMSV